MSDDQTPAWAKEIWAALGRFHDDMTVAMDSIDVIRRRVENDYSDLVQLRRMVAAKRALTAELTAEEFRPARPDRLVPADHGRAAQRRRRTGQVPIPPEVQAWLREYDRVWRSRPQPRAEWFERDRSA